MKTSKKNSALGKQDTQLRSIVMLQTKARSRTEVALKAGVAIRTLGQVIDGTFAAKLQDAKDSVSAKQIQGYIESLTRLASYFKVNIEDTLKEYGIDLTWPGVQDVISEANKDRLNKLAKQHFPDADSDIHPLLKIVGACSYEGRISILDLFFLIELQEKLPNTLTPQAVKDFLELRQTSSTT